MKTTITFSMRSIWCIIVLMIILPVSEPLLAQTAPYALSPKWMFGKKAGLDFTSGSPVVLAGNPINDAGQEATATICDPNKNIVMYCNNSKIYNGANVFFQNVNANNGQSSTDGAIIIPDPSSPTNQFFLFSGNDITGGNSGGINYYQIKNTAGVLSIMAGPVNLATGAQVNEALCAGTDTSGGYWIVAHAQTTQYWAWNVTKAGVNATKVVSNVATQGGSSYGSIKISQCQNRIASISNVGSLDVYNWDNVAGKVTGVALASYPAATYSNGYGCEFSMDGNMLYFTTLSANQIYQLDIGAGTVYPYPGANGKSSNNTAEMGTLQLGPDNKIYVTNVDFLGSTTYIGVVNSPNTSGAGSNYLNNGFTLYTGASWGYPMIYRGIANIAYTYPNTPVINAAVTGCSVNFSYVFQTYFKDNISIQPGSESWNFGDGSANGTGATPSHTYPNGTNSYKVTLTFKDVNCGRTWRDTMTVNTSCIVAPVTLISFTGLKNDEGSKLIWATASETNNDYFDIQRSEDGINFYSIGSVKGHGSTASASSYSFDDKAFNNIIYYRLAQHDIDGKITYSTIITINSGNSAPVISPNPFANNFTLTFAGKNVEIKVLDMLGRIVQKRTMEENTYSISLGDELNKGSYIICVNTDTENYYYKVIKE